MVLDHALHVRDGLLAETQDVLRQIDEAHVKREIDDAGNELKSDAPEEKKQG